MAADNVKKLYDALTNDGYDDLGTEQQFRERIKNPNSAKKLYDVMLNDGYDDIGTFEHFQDRLSSQSTTTPAPVSTPAPAPTVNSVQRQQASVTQHRQARPMYKAAPKAQHNYQRGYAGPTTPTPFALQQRKKGVSAFVQSLYGNDVRKGGGADMRRHFEQTPVMQGYKRQQRAHTRPASNRLPATVSRTVEEAQPNVDKMMQQQVKNAVDAGSSKAAEDAVQQTYQQLAKEGYDITEMENAGAIDQALYDAIAPTADKIVANAVSNKDKTGIFDKTIADALQEENAVWQKYNQDSRLVDAASPMSIETQRQANMKLDPDVLMKKLTSAVQKKSLNADVLRSINVQASKYGISPEDYYKTYVAPRIHEELQTALDKYEIEKYMPKTGIEYIMNGVSGSLSGMFYDWLTKSGKQNQYKDQAQAMTETGQNPHYNPGSVAKIARQAVGLISQAPEFAVGGELAGAATQKIAGGAIERMVAAGMTRAEAQGILTAELASKFGQRVAQNIVQSSVSGAINFATLEATGEAARQAKNYDGNDARGISQLAPEEVIKSALRGAASGAIFGVIGGTYAGATAELTGFGKIASRIAGVPVNGAALTASSNILNDIKVAAGGDDELKDKSLWQQFADNTMMDLMMRGTSTHTAKTAMGLIRGSKEARANALSFFDPRSNSQQQFGGNWQAGGFTDAQQRQLMTLTGTSNLHDALMKGAPSAQQKVSMTRATGTVEGNSQSVDQIMRDEQRAVMRANWDRLMQEPDLDAATKAQLCRVMGANYHFNPTVSLGKTSQAEDGTYYVDERDAAGMLNQRHTFASEEEATDYRTRQLISTDHQRVRSMVSSLDDLGRQALVASSMKSGMEPAEYIRNLQNDKLTAEQISELEADLKKAMLMSGGVDKVKVVKHSDGTASVEYRRGNNLVTAERYNSEEEANNAAMKADYSRSMYDIVEKEDQANRKYVAQHIDDWIMDDLMANPNRSSIMKYIEAGQVDQLDPHEQALAYIYQHAEELQSAQTKTAIGGALTEGERTVMAYFSQVMNDYTNKVSDYTKKNYAESKGVTVDDVDNALYGYPAEQQNALVQAELAKNPSQPVTVTSMPNGRIRTAAQEALAEDYRNHVTEAANHVEEQHASRPKERVASPFKIEEPLEDPIKNWKPGEISDDIPESVTPTEAATSEVQSTGTEPVVETLSTATGQNESWRQAISAGEQAVKADDANTIRQINTEYELACRRVSSLFAKGRGKGADDRSNEEHAVTIDIMSAMRTGDYAKAHQLSDAEIFNERQSQALHSYVDAAAAASDMQRAMDEISDQMVNQMTQTVKATADEQGFITYVYTDIKDENGKPKRYSVVSGNLNDVSGQVMLRSLDAEGNPTDEVQQVSIQRISRIEPQGKADDVIYQRTREIRMHIDQYYNDIARGEDFEPGAKLTMKLGDSAAEVTVVGVNEDGSINIQMDDTGDVMTVSREEAKQMLSDATEDGYNAQLDAEKAEADQRQAEIEAQRRIQEEAQRQAEAAAKAQEETQRKAAEEAARQAEQMKNPANRLKKDASGHYDFVNSQPEDVEEFLKTFGNDQKAQQAAEGELKRAIAAEQALQTAPVEENEIDGIDALMNNQAQSEQTAAAKAEAHRQTEFWKDQVERIRRRRENAQAQAQAQREAEERIKRDRARKARQAKYDKPINDAKKRLAGDDMALAILDDREPHTLEEAVAEYLQAGSIVKENYKDRFGVDQLGATGETGLSKKELNPLNYFFGKEADGARSIATVAERIYEDWPEELRQLGDVQDIRNTIIDLLQNSRTADDIIHKVDKNRISEAESVHEQQHAYDEALAEHGQPGLGELSKDEMQQIDREMSENNPLGGNELEEAPFSIGEVKTEEQIKKHNDEARNKGGLVVDSNSLQMVGQARDLLDTVGRQLGRTIVIDPDLERIGANGRASADGKTLSISPKIASKGDYALRYVVGHELTHLMKKGDKDIQDAWKSFAAMVEEAMGDRYAKEFEQIRTLYDERFDEIRRQAEERLKDSSLTTEERKKYQAQAGLKNLSDDNIQEEIICNFVGEKIFTDEKFVKDLVEKVSQSHEDSTGIVKRMYDFISKMLDYIKSIKHPTLSDRRAQVALERARDIWKDMYELTAAKQREKTGEKGTTTVEIAQSDISDKRYNIVAEDDNGNIITSENKLTGDESYNLASEEQDNLLIRGKRWSAREYRNNWVDKQVKKGRITTEQGEYIKNLMQQKADLARQQGSISKEMNLWNDAQISVDEKGRPMFSVVIPDDEYPINFGISLVCKRRRALDKVMRELASSGLIDQLRADPLNIVAINQIIKEHGLEIGCDLCYVEARRFRSIPNADKFTASWNQMVESLDKEGKFAHAHHNFGENKQLEDADNADTRQKLDEVDNDQLDFSGLDKVMEEERQMSIAKAKAEGKLPPKQPKTIRYKQAVFMKQHPESRRLLDRSDFVDAKGFENAHKKNRPVLALFNGTFGASNPKKSFGDTPYNSEILVRDRVFSRNKAFKMGGVRFQSFDDYVGKNWFDYLQAHADMSIRQLPAHTYSKEELCVKTYGLTGNKINMSGVPDVKEGCPAGLDEDGNYIFHEGYEIEVDHNGQKKIVKTDRQTFPWEEALKIRSAQGYRDNCGTIVVGVSDEHIWKMQHDKNVDMIIGYHSSCLNPIVAHDMGGVGKFTDYTDIQNERYGDSYGDNAGKSLTKAMKAKVPNINLLMAPKDAGGQAMGAREAVEYYIRWCEDHDIIPKFDKFCCKRENDAFDGAEQTYIDENGKKRRDIDDGYYKHIADFKIIAQDEKGNDYDVPQHEVRLVLPGKDDAFGSFDELTTRGVNEWQEIHNDIESEMYREDGKGIIAEINDRIINGSMVEDLHKLSEERQAAYKKAQEEKAKAEAVEDDQDSYAFGDYNAITVNNGDYSRGENDITYSFGSIPLENARQLSLFDENGEPKSTEQQVEDYKKLKESRAYEQLSLFDKDGNPSADVTKPAEATDAQEEQKTNPIDDIIEKNEATAKAIEAPQDVAVDVVKEQAKAKKTGTKEGVQDFGEKFGNARKDTARKGFKREGDFRPAWRKPYQFHNADEETAVKMNKYSINFDKKEENTEFDASKPFVAYTEEIVKHSGFKFTRRTPVTDANGKTILFHSEEEAEAAIPVFEAKRQGFTVKQDKETHEYVICKSSSTGKQVEYERFPSQEEAVMFLSTPEGCKSLLNHKSNNYELPPIEKVTREGMPDYRKGNDVTPEQFMSEFGFRGGEFGNWVKDDERQAFLNVAYDSFRDLANVLNVSPKALSLGGKLGIAFGSRGGTGSTKGALAHYEPDRVVINMTKLKGAGSLAHEWAHALDNYFGLQDAQINRTPGDDQASNYYLTEDRSWKRGTRREVRDIFKAIVKAMKEKTVTRAVDASDGDEVMGKLMKFYEEDVKSTRNEFARGLRTRKYNRKTRQYDEILHKPTEEDLKKYDELTKQLATADDFHYQWNPTKQAWRGTGSTAEQLYELTQDVVKGSGRFAPLNNIMFYVDKINRQRAKMRAAAANAEETVSVKTDMLRCSEFYDRDRVKPYWSTDMEMFARAFETYVNNKISAEGKSSDYLCYDKHTVSSILYKKSPYPGGEEYESLEKLFDSLFNTIQERTNEEGNVEMYSFGDIPEATHDDVKAQDQEYADAVESGDTEKAKAMLQKKADNLKAQVFAATDVPGYSVSKDYRPKKTIKVYKTFTVDPNGRPTALFVANGDAIPTGVWLKAKDAPHFTNQKNGRQYVISTKNKNTQGGATGVPVSLADISSEDIKNLMEQGAIAPDAKGNLPKTITALAYRPGWHAGDLPFFPQGGMQIEGSNYPNVHRYNQVVFECELSVDQDYSKHHTNDAGQVIYEDRQEMPTRGSYKFATNPMAKADDIGSWYIGGELKINRALTEKECNDILKESGRAPQEWQQYQDDDARKADMSEARAQAKKDLKSMTEDQKRAEWDRQCEQKYEEKVEALAGKDKSKLIKSYVHAYKGILSPEEAKAAAKEMTADEIRNELDSIYADDRDAQKEDFSVKAADKAYIDAAVKAAAYKYEHTTGALDLDKLNYNPEETDGGKKILDITYDNDGNLIPLSERFQADVHDERYSFGDVSEPTAEQKAMQAETDAALARKRNRIRPGDTMSDIVRKMEAQRDADDEQRLAEIRRQNQVQKGDTMADIIRKQNAIKEAEQDSYSMSRMERAHAAYEREKARRQKEIDDKQKALRQKLVDQLTYLINDKHLTVINRTDINRMLKNIQNADEKNISQMLAQGRTLVHHLTDKSQQKEIERLLKLKTQDVNGKNMSVAKNVSDSVRRIMEMIQGRVVDLKATGYDEDMTQLRRQNIFINAENKRLERLLEHSINNVKTSTDEQFKADEAQRQLEIRQKITDNKAKYEENLQSLRDLTAKRDEARAQQATEGEEDVNAAIDELMHKMDDAVTGNGTWTTSDSEKLTGLQILQMKQQADSQRKDINKLNRQLEDLEDSLAGYERAAKRPQRYVPVQRMEQLRQQIASMKNAIAMANDNLISSNDNLIQILSDLIADGKDSLYNKVEAEKSRKYNLLHGMLDDIQGRKTIPVAKEDRMKTHREGKIKKFFSAQLHSFEYLAKRINENTVGEDGWFYNYFVKGKSGVLQAENDFQEGMRDAVNNLDAKAKEIYGKSFNDAANANGKIDYHPGVYIYSDRAGMPVEEEVPLSKAQAMYLYMVWKMPDGRMKLQLQGFTDRSMEQVREYIGDDNIAYADWLQDTFLADQRAKYNDRYVEMYNTSMANIDNYVPLKIDSDDVRRETDISEESGRRKTLEERAGSLINRTVNTHRVDWTHGAFDVIAEHVKQMEEWNAFARVRKDLDYVLSNTYVRNQLDANSAGRYNQLYDASAIAAHAYTPAEAKYMDEVVGWLTKGLVGGNIAYRYTTAMKQMLSVPAFYGYSHDPRYLLALTKNIGIQYGRNIPAVLSNMITMGFSGKANFKSADKGKQKQMLSDNIVWCMNNVPSFRNRVLKGTAGMEFLDDELKGTAGKLVDKYLDYGMATNQMIDAVTCSIGIKSIYDYKYGKAEKAINADKTLTADQKLTALEEAKREAINDADIYYNATQQSNHAAFMAPMQLSRSMIDRALSVYQNASIGYARKAVSAAENLWKMKDWNRLKGQYATRYMNENPDMTPAEANKLAGQYLKQQALHNSIGAALYGYLLNWLWDWGGRGLLGLFQGDQDEKDKRVAGEDDNSTLDMTRLAGEIAEQASYPARGLTGMNIMSSLLNGNLSHPLLFYTEANDLEDQAKKLWKDDDYAGIASAAFFKGLRIAGFDIKVWHNIVEGAYGLAKDACTANRDHDAMLNLMFALNTPNSNRKQVAEEIYKGEDRDTYVRNILTAGKYTSNEYVALLPGMKMLQEKNMLDIYKEFELNKLLDDPTVKLKSAQKAQLDHYRTIEECQKAYDQEQDTDMKAALGKKLIKLMKQEEKENRGYNAEELIKKARASLVVKENKNKTYISHCQSDDVIEDEMLNDAIKERKPVYDAIEEFQSEDPASIPDYINANKKELAEYDQLKDMRNSINEMKRAMEKVQNDAGKEALMQNIRKLRKQALKLVESRYKKK